MSDPTTAAPPPALSESAALRFLNLPHSRRDWLRAQLESSLVGKLRCYSVPALDTLRRKILKNQKSYF